MPKYESRFDNFFLTLRLSRAEFSDMAAFTLQALQQAAPAGKYQGLADALADALKAYSATHTGQLSGQGRAATGTVAQALTSFREYVKRVERKHINPAYEPGSPDLRALFPKGRAALTDSTQATVLDSFGAFLQALDDRAAVFQKPLRDEGRALHTALAQALRAADGQAQTADTLRDDLADDRRAVSIALLRTYATLLAEHADAPARVAAFFDFSQANTGTKKSRDKSPSENQ